MFFVLSKLLQFMINPLLWVFLLLILSLINQKKAKLWSTFAIAIFFIFSNPLLSNFILKKWEQPAVPKENLPFTDVGIILTGTMYGEPIPNDQYNYHDGADRVTESLVLYKAGLIQKILVTGGSGSVLNTGFVESSRIASFLIESGIPQEDILIDKKARNTYENALYSKELLKKFELGDRRIILITSAFHMNRAMACFQKQQIETIGYPVDFRSSLVDWDISWLLPSPGSFETWNLLLKEWIGIIAYKVFGYL